MELHYEVYGPVVSKHHFFRNYADLNLPAVQKLCHTSMQSLNLSIDDMLFNAGETAKSIYFLTIGLMEYVRWDGKSNRMTEVKEDDWASEMVLWTPWEHRGSMKAKMQSNLNAISATDFHKVVMETKAGQLEASAYSFAAVKILEDMQGSFLSDLNGGDFDADNICQQVFPHYIKANHHNWFHGQTTRMSRGSLQIPSDEIPGFRTRHSFQGEGSKEDRRVPTASSSTTKPSVSFSKRSDSDASIAESEFES